MKTEQRQWTAEGGWMQTKTTGISDSADLVFVFGSRTLLEDSSKYNEVKEFYPAANIIVGSTSGEIMEDLVYDDSLVVTAVDFEKTEVMVATMSIQDAADSHDAGVKMAEKLKDVLPNR